jgi:hypothetical protein
MSRLDVEALLRAKGLEFTEQSGFLKVVQPGGRLYIAATKTVRRVDISGFEVPQGLGKVPHCGVFGAVKQQLRLGTDSLEALANLDKALDILMALPAPAPKEPKVKAPKAPKTAKAETEGLVPAPANLESDEAKVARIARIKEYAEKHGVSISKKSIASAAE